MITKTFIISLICLPLIGCVRHNQRSLQADESILLKICKLRFYQEQDVQLQLKDVVKSPINENFSKCSFQKCMEWFMSVNKFGDCPSNTVSINGEHECVDSCNGHDYRCQGVQKCCSYNCSRKCTNPLKMDIIPDRTLPPIPQNITLMSLERHRNIAEISWQVYYIEPPIYNLVYILEARSHIGYYFDKRKFSNWFSMDFEVTSSSKKIEKGGLMTNEFGANVRLRPGRWYQFRMSSVNGNGTRGYSESSSKFQLKELPKNPLPPRNFSIEIRPTLLKNNTVYTKAVWKQPRSSYPIEKYRIAWSLYLDLNNGSLWQNEAFVQEPSRHFEFWNLKPNSVYYLQIQALSSFGKKRCLKSPKESLLLNTAISSNNTIGNFQSGTIDSAINQGSKINVTVRFIGSKKFGLLVRVIWPDYMIGSFIELCSGEAECLSKSSTKDMKVIRTKKNHFDFIDLKYSTKYSFRLRKSGRNVVSKTFITPVCSRFLRKHAHVSHTCS